MDAQDTQENNQRETRGRPGKLISLTLDLPMAEFQSAHVLLGRRIKQEGRYMTLERIVIDAIQHYAKTFGSQE